MDCVRVSLLSGLPLTLSQQASDNAIQASEQVPYQISLLPALWVCTFSLPFLALGEATV